MSSTRIAQAVGVAAVVLAAGAAAFNGGTDEYELVFDTLDSGGGFSESTDENAAWDVAVTFAQPDARLMTGGGYALEGGFWPGPELADATIGVATDVRPAQCPNFLSIDERGVATVAVLGAPGFDVSQVDPTSVELVRVDGVGGAARPRGGAYGPASEMADLATPSADPSGCHGAGADGFVDYLFCFRTDHVQGALGLDALAPGASLDVRLRGRLLDGTPFAGEDRISVASPCRGRPTIVFDVIDDGVGGTLADIWIGVEPPALGLVGGGFGWFERCFDEGQVVTATAPVQYRGLTLRGWRVDGVLIDAMIETGPAGATVGTTEVVTDGESHDVSAVYSAR